MSKARIYGIFSTLYGSTPGGQSSTLFHLTVLKFQQYVVYCCRAVHDFYVLYFGCLLDEIPINFSHRG